MTIFYFDFLKFLAILAVVVLHVNAHFLNQFTILASNSDRVSVIVFDCLTRFCVPMFFLISGSLLLGRKEKIKIFFNKRLKRLFGPFIFWSIFYFFWAQKNINFSWKFFSFIIYPTYYHLWFGYALILIYFLWPILKKFVNFSSRKQLKILLLFSSFTLIYFFYYPNSIIWLAYNFYSLYFLWGYYLNQLRIKKFNFKLSWLFLFIALICQIIVSILYNFKNLSSNSYYREYFNLFTFVVSLNLFLIFKNFLFDQKFSLKIKKILSLVASKSLGIYFIHVFIMDLFFLNNFKLSFLPRIFAIPILSILIFLISFLIVIFFGYFQSKLLHGSKKFFNFVKFFLKKHF